jgi:hypothetical protein
LLRRRPTAVAARDVTLLGRTTEGAPLSPPRAAVLSGGPITWARCRSSRRASKRWCQRCPASASAWRLRHLHGPGAVRAPRRTRRRPARSSGWQRPAPRCAPHARCASRVTCTPPHGSPWGASAVDGPRATRDGQAWTRGRRSASDAVGRRPLWTSGPHGGVGSSSAPRGVRHGSNALPPRWTKPARCSMPSCCPPPRMRWSGATGAIA